MCPSARRAAAYALLPRPALVLGEGWDQRSRRLLLDFLRARLLHGAHVEIQQAFALVALFLVLLPQLDDLLEDPDIEPLALRLRKYFLLLLVELGQFSV